jgi:hypothetical protein
MNEEPQIAERSPTCEGDQRAPMLFREHLGNIVCLHGKILYRVARWNNPAGGYIQPCANFATTDDSQSSETELSSYKDVYATCKFWRNAHEKE